MRKRRGRGEGSIYKDSRGNWTAYVTVGVDQNGRRKRKYVYGRTKEIVRQKLTTLQANPLASAQTGRALATSDFLDRWLKAHEENIRTTTYTSYEQIIRLHIKPFIGGVRLNKLGSPHGPLIIEGLLSELRDAGRSKRIRKYVYQVLNVAFKQAIKWRLLVMNPLDAVDSPVVAKHKVEPLTPQQCLRFFQEAESDRLYAL